VGVALAIARHETKKDINRFALQSKNN